MHKLILFDIDGTLIGSGGAGTEAMNRTLHEMTGIVDGFGHVNCAGKTDPQIIREGAATHGIDTTDGFMSDFFAIYPRHLAVTVYECKGHVKPGVRALLERLQRTEGLVTALLTGNLEQGARIKLEPFSLNHYFAFGAYGSDEEERNLLLPVAVRKFVQIRSAPIFYADCILIGDTPRDVECAKVHGAHCLAVATGPYSMEALYRAKAGMVVGDLFNTDLVIDWIRSR